jgi:hypothetical protein
VTVSDKMEHCFLLTKTALTSQVMVQEEVVILKNVNEQLRIYSGKKVHSAEVQLCLVRAR